MPKASTASVLGTVERVEHCECLLDGHGRLFSRLIDRLADPSCDIPDRDPFVPATLACRIDPALDGLATPLQLGEQPGAGLPGIRGAGSLPRRRVACGRSRSRPDLDDEARIPAAVLVTVAARIADHPRVADAVVGRRVDMAVHPQVRPASLDRRRQV